ncbi:hypothetical protein [Chitiniphilus eburneus]|uniref:hypothetical protein n=1 Tax=Chitiniphilus eburneus TaxID=2571148 RepID=UPI00145FC681|nr:hypothetical protein [Chitiniphilus eburneus]
MNPAASGWSQYGLFIARIFAKKNAPEAAFFCMVSGILNAVDLMGIQALLVEGSAK